MREAAMQIDSNTLRLALLKIFMNASLPVTSWRAYAEVARDWKSTGLRGSDLLDAVHEMMGKGELLSSDLNGVPSLALAAGMEQSLTGPKAYLNLGSQRDEDALLGVLTRESGGYDLGLRRRADDPATVSAVKPA
jgi:hypothetical protein